MENPLLELFRHKTWATAELIDFCRSRDDEHLDATIAGTFGSVRETLRHLVRSDESYYFTLTKARVSEEIHDGPLSLGELADRTRLLGSYWETLALDPDIANREIITSDGWRTRGAIPIAQSIHHADDHRTHVLSIFGARSIEGPNLSIWGYAEEHGLMVEIAPSA